MDENLVSALGIQIAENILKKPNREIKPDEPLISSGIIDSFSLVDLALLIEDNFGVIIDDSELNSKSFDTLSQLAELITKRKS